MNKWEFSDTERMLHLWIGKHYGDDPENNLEHVIEDKEKYGYKLADALSLKETDDVLDLGSGPGYIARALAHKVRTLRCVDVSKSFLDLAKETCKDLDNVSYTLCDGLSLEGVENNSIDMVCSTFVFIHLGHFETYAYLKEIHRVLRKGGRFYFNIKIDADFDVDHFIQPLQLFWQFDNLNVQCCVEHRGTLRLVCPLV